MKWRNHKKTDGDFDHHPFFYDYATSNESRNRCNCRRSDNDVRGSVGTGSTVKTQLNSAN
ncbi:hypothetical protein WP50_02110 [Lactiplantibacillus plantarum]|nr:hypothetical protein WP50_02110 [Lactiplantibacillus plantarum]